MRILEKIKTGFAVGAMVMGSGMVTFAVWSHAHASEPIMENAAAIAENDVQLASGFHINREIRAVASEMTKKERALDRLEDRLIRIEVSPRADEPDMMERRREIEIQIDTLEKELDRLYDHLDRSQVKEDRLIAAMATS